MAASRFICPMLILMRNLGLEIVAIHPDSGKIASCSSSWPGWSRPFTSFPRRKDVDARHKATAVRHDFCFIQRSRAIEQVEALFGSELRVLRRGRSRAEIDLSAG